MGTRLRVLMVQHAYYPSIGGAEEYVKALAEGLVKRGHKVTVYTTNTLAGKPADLPKKEVINKVEVRRFDVKLRFYSFNWVPEMFHKLQNLNDFDIITGYGYHLLTSLKACKYAKRNEKPFVLNGIDVIIPPRMPGLAKVLKRLYDLTFGRYILKNSAAVISLTGDQISEYLKLGAERKKTWVISPGIDLERYRGKVSNGFEKKYRIKKSDKLILYVGRLVEHKGVQDVIKLLPKMDSNVKFFVVGEDGGYRAELERLANEHNVKDRVVFTGAVSEKDVQNFFKVADVFVLPTKMEAFGIVLLEAMAAKTPCISYDIPAVRELIEAGERGYLVKDEKELLEKMNFLLKDNKTRNKFIKNGLEFVKKYSKSEVGKKLEKIYLEVI